MSRITQKGATGPLALHASGIFQQSSDANLATLVGSRWDLSDGREVIFVSNSATAILTSGLLCQDAAIVANHAGMVTAAFTAYSATTGKKASITVNLGATALTADQYQGGFLSVDSGTGIGQYLRIESNAAAVLSGSGVITLEDSPNTALVAASSVVSLIPPHGKSVILNPTTPTNVPVGVTLYPLTASYYGFLVSKGLTGAVSDATAPEVGKGISPSTTTAGTIAKNTGTSTVTLNVGPIIGYTAVAAASATSHSVFVNL